LQVFAPNEIFKIDDANLKSFQNFFFRCFSLGPLPGVGVTGKYLPQFSKIFWKRQKSLWSVGKTTSCNNFTLPKRSGSCLPGVYAWWLSEVNANIISHTTEEVFHSGLENCLINAARKKLFLWFSQNIFKQSVNVRSQKIWAVKIDRKLKN